MLSWTEMWPVIWGGLVLQCIPRFEIMEWIQLLLLYNSFALSTDSAT